MESLQRVLEKYHLDKWFQKDNLIVLVLLGVLLVVISLPMEEKEEANKVETFTGQQGALGESDRPRGENGYDDLYSYATYLEEELEEALSQMRGVGEVKVMITLEASEEQVVEKDEMMVRNNTTEEDSQGGSRSIYQMDSGEETIYQKLDSGEMPYVTKTILPKVSGVLVVAEGAGNGNISKSIVDIAQALFHIDAHKICVVSKE